MTNSERARAQQEISDIAAEFRRRVSAGGTTGVEMANAFRALADSFRKAQNAPNV